jgi:hypothetical protein
MNIIHDFFATKKVVPTAAKLLPIVTEKISKGTEKHWLHMEEVQFEAAHFG